MKNNINKKTGLFAVLILAVIIMAVAALFHMYPVKDPVFYPVRGLSNMCAYNGTVYSGVNAPYGELIKQESSIFTIQDGKVYYVLKVLDAFESTTDELLTLEVSDMDGSNPKILAEDVFLPGSGHEKLIGDKLFYGYGYDDDYRMKYAYIDLNTGERREIESSRIDHILGYDGTYLYYNGYDSKKDENILGRLTLKSGKDESLISYAPIDEEGYIDSVLYDQGKLYCLTLLTKSKGYDYRTYEYHMLVRNAEDGSVEYEIPLSFQGSSNYSFLIQDDKLIVTQGGKILHISKDGSNDAKIITNMKAEEYWGILHFASADGFLYYEAIAETDEITGNNDYFYRVPLKGGNSELLKEWYTF